MYNYFLTGLFTLHYACGRYKQALSDVIFKHGLYKYFMEVPVKADEIEVPIMVLDRFINYTKFVTNRNAPEVDKLVVSMFPINYSDTYTTVYTTLNHCKQSFAEGHFLKVSLKGKGDGKYWYITNGAIFNKDYQPLLISSVKLRRVLHPETHKLIHYEFVQPLIRIKSSLVVTKEDAMEKYIGNTALKYLSDNNYYMPIELKGICPNSISNPYNVPIMLSNNIWDLKAVEIPSISTTTKELNDLLITNIDEMLNDC